MGAGSAEAAAAQEAKQKEMEEARKSMLSQVLTPEALERLNRVSIVKPEMGVQVGNHIIGMARSGKLKSQVDEPMLITLLESIADSQKKVTKVKVQRRKAFGEDDDEEDFADF